MCILPIHYLNLRHFKKLFAVEISPLKNSPRKQLNSDSMVPLQVNGNAMSSELVGRGSLPDMSVTNGKVEEKPTVAVSH